jgi:hypothetical protein
VAAAVAEAAVAAEAAEAAEAALALAAEAALALAAEAAELAAELAGELAGELPAEAAARRGELAAGARADRFPIALTTQVLTAGFDKSDPANPCLVCSGARACAWPSPLLNRSYAGAGAESVICSVSTSPPAHWRL